MKIDGLINWRNQHGLIFSLLQIQIVTVGNIGIFIDMSTYKYNLWFPEKAYN